MTTKSRTRAVITLAAVGAGVLGTGVPAATALPAAAIKAAAVGAAATRVVTVATDGSGDFRTVQAAVDAAPSGGSGTYEIDVRPGTYRGAVTVPSAKPHITLRGTGGDGSQVVIVENHSHAAGYGTAGSATVTVYGHDFTAENLTLANDYDEAANGYSQAVAVNADADRMVFDHVRFLGNQDTLLVGNAARAYFRESYVEGDVDFVFGGGTAVFDRCEIHSLYRGSTSNNGYVTAASTPGGRTYGFLIYRSALTSDAPARSVYLGRPWHPGGDPTVRPQVLYRESYLGAHVRDDPWTGMSGFSWRDARFSEYHDSGPGATVNANRPQLSDADAPSYTPQAYLSGSDGWNPIF